MDQVTMLTAVNSGVIDTIPLEKVHEFMELYLKKLVLLSKNKSRKSVQQVATEHSHFPRY